MEDKIQNIVHLIQQSDLDQTIKDILIRDLQADGLNDFLREQIKAYCLEGIKRLDVQIEQKKNWKNLKIQLSGWILVLEVYLSYEFSTRLFYKSNPSRGGSTACASFFVGRSRYCRSNFISISHRFSDGTNGRLFKSQKNSPNCQCDGGILNCHCNRWRNHHFNGATGF